MVTAMMDEWDPQLMRAFAQARDPLAEDAFVAKLLQNIERARRIRLARQIFAITAALGFVSLNMRLVGEQTVAALQVVADTASTLVDLLMTPWGWAASMLIGAWVVLRTRPSRR